MTRIPGLAAFWDFVLREDSGQSRYLARRGDGSVGWPLDAVNYVRDYWHRGRSASYADFPRLGRGPFGEAVHFREETDPDFRPVLLLPREAFHGSALDVGGAGQSVSMAVWIVYEGGNHAIAGIWHEGTDLKTDENKAAVVEQGRRQYALFAGLAANVGAVAAHVSENGRNSFGDRYARNLAVTKDVLPAAAPDAGPEALDNAWSVAGFVFDNSKNTVTAYLNGEAREFWVEDPARHPFFQWPARAWQQAQWHRIDGLQIGEDPEFPAEQYYEPPEGKPLKRQLVHQTERERIWDLSYPYTHVRETWLRDASPGRHNAVAKNVANGWRLANRELLALKVNPFWFGHDLYRPKSPAEGGPFTIGRVIHSSRSAGTRQYIGGVAVFHRALSAGEMRKLAGVGRERSGPSGKLLLLEAGDPRQVP
ncbi:MAG: hypothetical protein LC114_18890 [Bryobacterales bacterium]|nr:hypothetical protein [Bryobacterales bacterium]